jgi:hypothetical protein
VRWGPTLTPYPATIVGTKDDQWDIRYTDGTPETVPPERICGSFEEYLPEIAHNVLTPVVGLLGGALACWFHGRKSDANRQPSP